MIDDYTTTDGLKLHPLWPRLTLKQQRFVAAYLENGFDKVAAAKAAFNCATDKLSLDVGSRALRHYAIRKLIAIYQGLGTDDFGPMCKAELTDLISQRLRSGTLTDRAFEVLSAQLILLKGWGDMPNRAAQKLVTKGKDSKPAKESDVDELVRALERKRANEQE